MSSIVCDRTHIQQEVQDMDDPILLYDMARSVVQYTIHNRIVSSHQRSRRSSQRVGVHQQDSIFLEELEPVLPIRDSTSSNLVSHLSTGDLSCTSLQKVELVKPESIWLMSNILIHERNLVPELKLAPD